MKKFILTAVMAFTLLYVGLIDFSYAEDLAKGSSELTEVEKAYENLPISLEEKKIEQEADDSYEKDREDDVVKYDEDEVDGGDDEKVEVSVEGTE
jgi:hypothetical protein